MRRLSPLLGLALLGCNLDVAEPDFIPRPANAADVNVDFCFSDQPNWLAIKNEGRDWLVVSRRAQQRYQIAVSPKVAVAYGLTVVNSTPASSFSIITVLFVTAEELANASCGALIGTKILYANVAGAGPRDRVFAAMASGFGQTDPNASFGSPTQVRIDGAAAGPADMLAYLVPDLGGRPKYILRHGIDVPSRSLLAPLDFTGAEATFTGRFPVSVAGGANASVFATFLSALGTDRELGVTSVLNGSGNYMALPQPVLASGDLHKQTVAGADGRNAMVYVASPGLLNVALGPALATPTIATVGAGPSVLRMRATLPSQADYPSFASAAFYQGLNRSVTVVVSRGYLEATPAEWQLEIPDLSFLVPEALLQAGVETQWQVEARDSPAALFFGDGGAADGTIVRCAMAASSASLLLRGCRSPLAINPRAFPAESGGILLSP